MPMISATDAAEKHARRTIGAVEDYKAGVTRVTESPTAKAAASKDKWIAGIQRAAEKGKFEAGLRRVSLDQWKSKTLNKGAGRIPAGVNESKPKTEAFFKDFLPHVAAGQAKLSGMPSNTLEDNIGRMVEMTRHNAGFSRSK